jgi:hypothetical protein
MDAVGGKGPGPGIDGEAAGGDEEVLTGPRPTRWRWRWWVALMVAAVVGVLVVVAAHNRGGSRTATRTAPAPSRSAARAFPTSSPSVTRAAAPLTTIEVGHPLLGITADWQLLGLGARTMLRIDFAHSRITRTTLPALQSNGPVFFLATPHGAIVRPLDFVPGYLVPDGQPPRALTGALGTGGVALPGPQPGQYWKSEAGGQDAMQLVGPDGAPVKSAHSRTITLPPSMNPFPAPDGAGYVLVTGVGGTYDATPDGLRRITTGAVLAVGRTRWLADECNPHAHCSMVVIDRTTGARRVLRAFAADPTNISGAVSPDLRTVALLLPRDAVGGSPTLHLLNLATGADRRLPIGFRFGVSVNDSAVVWSPDSRWLFAADTRGELHAIDPRTGHLHGLGVEIPPINQLAVR